MIVGVVLCLSMVLIACCSVVLMFRDLNGPWMTCLIPVWMIDRVQLAHGGPVT